MGTQEFNVFGVKASGNDDTDDTSAVREETPPGKNPLAGGAAQAETPPRQPGASAGISVPKGILAGLKTPPRAANLNAADRRFVALSGAATEGREAARPQPPRKNGISYDIQPPNPEYGFLVPEETKRTTISRASTTRRNLQASQPISYLYRNGTSNPIEDSWGLMAEKPLPSATELRSMARNVLVDSSILAGNKPKHQVFLDVRLAVLTDSKLSPRTDEPAKA